MLDLATARQFAVDSPHTRRVRPRHQAAMTELDVETLADLTGEIEELLGDGMWRTTSEIAAPRDKGGIGAKREAVEKALEAGAELFLSVTGDLSVELAGRNPTARHGHDGHNEKRAREYARA